VGGYRLDLSGSVYRRMASSRGDWNELRKKKKEREFFG
jgi:hypothetical protein